MKKPIKKQNKVMVEVSARHCHLSQNDVEKLFGAGYKLKPLKWLSQPGQFAAEEEVFLVTPKGEMKVRIIGPIRPDTQVELATTDCYKIGVKPVVKISGDVKGTPGVKIKGPKGEIDLKQGVIVAQRHLHLAPEELKKFGLKNGQIITIEVKGTRPIIFKEVAVRSGQGHKESFMIDTDEGNACGYFDGLTGLICK